MQIRDAMTKGVRVARPDAPVIELARRMRDEDIGSIPVAENDKLIGMVTDRDIVTRGVAESVDLTSIRARDVMSPKVLYCFDNDSVVDVLANMREQQVRRLPVVNRDKRLVGVVSIGDLSQIEAKSAGNALQGISRPLHH
jgi:CBS domain-containing protein